MSADAQKAVNSALAALPSREEIRQRIAENLQERQVLRQMLRLVEQRQAGVAGGGEGARRD